MEDLKKVNDSNDLADIKSKTEALSQNVQKIGADMYKQAQADPASQPNQPEDKKPDEGEKPQEGEFKDK